MQNPRYVAFKALLKIEEERHDVIFNVQCAMCNVQCRLCKNQQFSFRSSLFQKACGVQGQSPARRRHAPALLGVNFKNSPADCFWKRGILAENAPYFRLKQNFPRRSKAAQ